MSHCADIRGLMAEARKLHVAAETHKKERGRDRGRRLLEIEGNQLVYQADELRRQAAEAFAALNGWRPSRSRFGVKALLRAGVHDGYGQSKLDDPVYRLDLLDHPLFFRELARPYRAAAIVGQPYDTTSADAPANRCQARPCAARAAEGDGKRVVSRLDPILLFHTARDHQHSNSCPSKLTECEMTSRAKRLRQQGAGRATLRYGH